MTNPDARPEPLHVVEHEGEFVRIHEGKFPAITLPMEAGYVRNTHLRLALEVRVRHVRYDEIGSGDHKGELVRQHIFVLEDVQMLDSLTAEQADPGVGGSANELVQHVFELESQREACYYDVEHLEVVHVGRCEFCADKIQTVVDTPSNVVALAGLGDPGF